MAFANRESLAALCIFACSVLVAHYSYLFEPWAYHAINTGLYALLSLYAFNIKVKRAALLVVVFQYIMAWDAFIFSHVETVLYANYALISFALNALLLFTIGKAGRNDVTNYRADYRAPAYRVFNHKLVAAHKETVRKG